MTPSFERAQLRTEEQNKSDAFNILWSLFSVNIVTICGPYVLYDFVNAMVVVFHADFVLKYHNLISFQNTVSRIHNCHDRTAYVVGVAPSCHGDLIVVVHTPSQNPRIPYQFYVPLPPVILLCPSPSMFLKWSASRLYSRKTCFT